MKNKKVSLLGIVSAFLLTAVISTGADAAIGAKNSKRYDAGESTILRIGLGHTDLTATLAHDTPVNYVSPTESVNTALIKKNVAKASIVHADFNDFYGKDLLLNAYLSEAFIQGKLMVLENTGDNNDVETSALPFMVTGEFVLFQPGILGASDKIVVYGNGESLESFQSTSGEIQGDNAAAERAAEQANTSSTRGISFSDLESHERKQALSDIRDTIATLSNPSAPSKSTFGAITKTGGAFGYACPSAAKNERLCWAAIVTNAPYHHLNGDADINVLHHFSVAQYRTDQATAVVISPNGSANPNMKKNTQSHRGFFLETVNTLITPTQTDGMQLWSRTPANQNNQGQITSTTGMSFGISGDISQDPSLGASITYSESQSVTMSLNDWSVTTSSNGTNAEFNFDLSRYNAISDWVTHPVFQTAKLHGVPNISRYGLQYTAESIWLGDKNKSGTFSASLRTKVMNSEIYFTENDIFHWKANKRTWTHTLGDGTYTFNNGWLKRL